MSSPSLPRMPFGEPPHPSLIMDPMLEMCHKFLHDFDNLQANLIEKETVANPHYFHYTLC